MLGWRSAKCPLCITNYSILIYTKQLFRYPYFIRKSSVITIVNLSHTALFIEVFQVNYSQTFISKDHHQVHKAYLSSLPHFFFWLRNVNLTSFFHFSHLLTYHTRSHQCTIHKNSSMKSPIHRQRVKDVKHSNRFSVIFSELVFFVQGALVVKNFIRISNRITNIILKITWYLSLLWLVNSLSNSKLKLFIEA